MTDIDHNRLHDIDHNRLHDLARAIWMYVDTDGPLRMIQTGDSLHIIEPEDKGIGGAIARLCVFFDDYVDAEFPPSRQHEPEVDEDDTHDFPALNGSE